MAKVFNIAISVDGKAYSRGEQVPEDISAGALQSLEEMGQVCDESELEAEPEAPEETETQEASTEAEVATIENADWARTSVVDLGLDDATAEKLVEANLLTVEAVLEFGSENEGLGKLVEAEEESAIQEAIAALQ